MDSNFCGVLFSNLINDLTPITHKSSLPPGSSYFGNVGDGGIRSTVVRWQWTFIDQNGGDSGNNMHGDGSGYYDSGTSD